MRGETRERWITLCEKAATEQDAEKLLEFAKEINSLLDEKEANIRGQLNKSPETASHPRNE